jgi:hypothetical protein
VDDSSTILDEARADLSFLSGSAVRSSELDDLSDEVQSLRTLMIVAIVIASVAVAASVIAVYFVLKKNR